ncbi:MAG TPA: GAF domain-containing sensor histidine kinase [Devosia sp.]|nr:GAF domain-containing sensor histidine kinase [Devosia sp.]
MLSVPHDFQADLDSVAEIGVIPKILDVISRSTGMGFVAVARVTETRWITCAVKDDINFGLVPGSELEVKSTICDEIRDSREGVVIDHVAEHPHFKTHHTPLQYGFESYISMPITMPDGEFFGTLCAIDPRPAKLDTPETIGMFQLYCDLIAMHLQDVRENVANKKLLMDERGTAELREQFMAVLGHDLRNPLASITAGAQMLEREPLTEKSKTIVGLMLKSSRRMRDLVENVLDFARGRLGGGIQVDHSNDAPIGPVLEQVIAELRTIHPDRDIRTALNIVERVPLDQRRLGQLLSNLLGNAIAHGAADHPIVVSAATSGGGGFRLYVTNGGEPIPAEILPTIFEPFVRSNKKSGGEGLGLGLYIANAIAKAEGGMLTVSSTPDETRFTFERPAP